MRCTSASTDTSKPDHEPKNGQNNEPLVQWQTTLSIKTVSEANKHEHWRVGKKRHDAQKLYIRSFLHYYAKSIRLPCTIKLTRIAPRKLDSHDNLPMSFKYIVDEIAKFLFPEDAAGQADNRPELKFIYDQEKGEPKEYKVKITFYHR